MYITSFLKKIFERKNVEYVRMIEGPKLSRDFRLSEKRSFLRFTNIKFYVKNVPFWKRKKNKLVFEVNKYNLHTRVLKSSLFEQ